ncbi:glycosyltransferase [Magnetospirillum sp. SS-4]|uniref:glycosyltransferase family protein n=1 Tax=Magnetospirillum sp. SS-4 TaxID=2681465 RepID=UPI00137C93A1|nr:glycosyltransferase [Magnetospirillum sp. SS-4]CAA7626116.1 hypothetical protein MTBSS4_60042 [Magnetospirillum sp. SS-4]
MTDTVFLLGNIRAADWANIFLQDLARAFANLGRDAVFLMCEDGPLEVEPARLAAPGSFIVDINGKRDTGDYPKFSLVVDHPLAHPRLNHPGSRTVLGTVDAGHAVLGGISPAPAVFVPHGGPAADADALTRRRDIDVLYVGNIPERFIPSAPLEELALEAGRLVGHCCRDPFESLERALAGQGRSPWDFGREELRRLLAIATDEAQRLARTAAILGIRDCVFHVIGEIADEVRARLPGNVVVHGFNRSFAESRDLWRRSRLLINITQKFPRGSHERIWYGMASGTALVTNQSSFVAGDFTHGESILFYQDPRQVGELVAWALEGDRAAALAAAALPVYQAAHTWEERAERILAAMSGLRRG